MSESPAYPEPGIPQKKPIVVDVSAGETYWWCTCGRSQNQPFCDGSHNSTDFAPLEWLCDDSEKVAFCTCKHTKTPPLCDGTHREL